MINIKTKKECCGCTACANICPVEAISMKKDNEGFLYPTINKKKCINCGMCDRVCPFNELNRKSEEEVNEIYGAHSKNKELLIQSSSGGIFGELALNNLNKNGKIVGVNNDCKYMIIDNKESLKELFGSKYVQAELSDIFKKTKKELDSNTTILFAGTPCIINGLKNYLKKDYQNLYTCDFICHGVPSNKLLDNYKIFFKNKIKYINFRDKENGWHNYSVCLYLKNKKYKSLAIDNEYMNAYFKNYCLRESCYACQAKGKERKSDITLGDYWGIDKDKKIYNYYGNSIVVLNTDKGIKLFKEIKNNLECEKLNKQELEKNSSYYDSAIRPNERDNFYKEIETQQFKKIIRKYNLSPSIIRKIKIKIKNMKG